MLINIEFPSLVFMAIIAIAFLLSALRCQYLILSGKLRYTVTWCCTCICCRSERASFPLINFADTKPCEVIGGAGYTQYEHGNTTMFASSAHIEQLSLEDVLSIRFPNIHPIHSLVFIGWSEDTPANDTLGPLDPRLSIPHLDDLKLFLADQACKYNNGFRAVIVRFEGKASLFYCCQLY